jgi:putative inorganic carbon (hco3(-)) transporter
VTKPGMVNRILVSLFSGSIASYIIFGAYYKKGIKAVLLLSLISLVMIGFRENKTKISAFFTQYFSSRYAPFIFFGLSAFISTILSRDFPHSRHIFIEHYILYFIVFEIGRRFFNSKTVALVFDESFGLNIFGFMKYVFIFAGLLMGIGGVVDYIRFHPERLFTVFGQIIQIPRYIIYFLPVVYCLMFKGNTLTQRILAILSFAMLFACMIFNGARAAWIAGATSILLASFLINKRYLKYFIPGFLVFLCLVYFFVPMRLSNFATYSFRKDIMLAAVNIFRDNFIFGAGPGVYEKLVANYSQGYVTLHAHNMYLEMLAELGIVGLTAFLSIFVAFYVRVRKELSMLNGSTDKFLFTGLLASNAGLFIIALFSSVIMVGFNDAPLFWLIFGMAFGLKNAQIENGPIKHEEVSDG